MMRLNGVLAAGLLLVAATDAMAQAYPNKPVRLVVPFAPGGRVEVIARVIGQSLNEQLGQPFIVESRAGAGGAIGSDGVARSAPDGYTLLLASAGTHAILPNIDKKIPYDSIKDFTPIANIAEGFTFVGANLDVPAKTFPELVALAKQQPGKINFATSGIGTYGHFAGEMLKLAAGVDIVHVPYRGSGPAMTDLTGGHVQLMIAGELVDLAKANRVRVLATTNERRWFELPDVPTMKELGYPQFTAHSWIGLLGPANLPADITQKLSQAVEKALASPATEGPFKSQGVVTRYQNPAAFAEQIKADRAAFAEIVSKAKLTFE